VNGNIANGGRVIQWGGRVVFAQTNEWFMNADDKHIFYSNRADNNRLYRKRSEADPGNVLVKHPCSGIVVFGDGIYFVNENDRKVYRCSKEGKGITPASSLEATEFGVLSDGTVYANPNARRLCLFGSQAYFADAGNNFALTMFDVESGQTDVFPAIRPSYINVYNGEVYYADRMRENKLYRFGGAFSIFGDSVACLHVIGDFLYFISGGKWRRLSLTNFGDAEEV